MKNLVWKVLFIASILIIVGCKSKIFSPGKASEIPQISEADLQKGIQACQLEVNNCLDSIAPQFKELDNNPTATEQDLDALLEKSGTITIGTCINKMEICMAGIGR